MRRSTESEQRGWADGVRETATAHGETFEAFRRSPGRVSARASPAAGARPGREGRT